MTAITIHSHFRAETWTGEVPNGLSLDDLFRFFNRVTEDDAIRLDALGYNLPSLSVGDTITLGSSIGGTWLVEPAGFSQVAAPPTTEGTT